VTLTASAGSISQGGSAGGTWTWSIPGPDGPASAHVVITADDGDGSFGTTASFDVAVENVAPTAAAAGPAQAVPVRGAFTLNGSWTDPATTLDAPYAWTWTPLTPAIDASGHALQPASGSSAYATTVPYAASISTPGTYHFRFAVTDKDGGSRDTTVAVTVRALTFDELEALVRQFSNNAGVANGLIAKLEAASNAPNANARKGQLGAFANQVRAQSGKAFTAEEAATLLELVALL
jgi:hypothetical protein